MHFQLQKHFHWDLTRKMNEYPTYTCSLVCLPTWARVSGRVFRRCALSFVTASFSFQLLTVSTGASPLNHRCLDAWCLSWINCLCPPSDPDTYDILHQLMLHLRWKGILICYSHKSHVQLKMLKGSNLTHERYECKCHVFRYYSGNVSVGVFYIIDITGHYHPGWPIPAHYAVVTLDGVWTVWLTTLFSSHCYTLS